MNRHTPRFPMHRRLTAVLLTSLATLAAFAGVAAAGDCPPRPALILEASAQTSPGVPVTLPLGFANNGNTIVAIAFSLDLAPTGLAFDPTDADMDGVPDAVTLPAGAPPVVVIDYDPADTDGEIDVLLADLGGTPLPEGVIFEIELTPSQAGTAASWIGFSGNPPPSFSNDLGEDVAGSAQVLGGPLFTDGFESGDTCVWSGSQPGPASRAKTSKQLQPPV